MKSDASALFTAGFIAFCLFAGGVITANADYLSGGAKLDNADYSAISYHQERARFKDASSFLDHYQESPCERFQASEIFDSFDKAFLAPEKVKCLMPELAGEDAGMKRLPARIGALVNLEVLSFGCLEKLEALPVEIGNLRKLESLVIDNGNGCAMNVSIPRSIGKLENLRVLRLYGALDARDGGLDLPARQRRSKTLPAEIGNLRRLELLDLGRNGLKTVPPQIASLSRLKTLRLDYNDLRTVPAFVGNFKNLKELFLNSNRIADLPPSMARLNGLKVYMGDNGIKPRDQKRLRSRFPKIVFSFENEFD